jgi:hypothetical protein
MTVTVEIPDALLARLQKEAESRGLSIDQWLLEIAEERAPDEGQSSGQERSLEEVFAKIRGLADDLDLSRDPSPGRDVAL